MYLCISESGIYAKKNDVLAKPPFSETIPQGVLIKIERGKAKNIKKRNLSVIKLVKY